MIVGLVQGQNYGTTERKYHALEGSVCVQEHTKQYQAACDVFDSVDNVHPQTLKSPHLGVYGNPMSKGAKC